MEKTGWTAHTGYVQDLWKHGIVKTRWHSTPKPENTHIFLCGAPAMIEDMVDLLEQEGFTEHTKKTPGQIHAERYW
jgi:ferredoxin--NADP+ reductase